MPTADHTALRHDRLINDVHIVLLDGVIIFAEYCQRTCWTIQSVYQSIYLVTLKHSSPLGFLNAKSIDLNVGICLASLSFNLFTVYYIS